MSFEGLTPHQLSSWKEYILDLLEKEDEYSPYTLICDFGNYDDSYEIGRVVQILHDAGEIAFTEHGNISLPVPKSDDIEFPESLYMEILEEEIPEWFKRCMMDFPMYPVLTRGAPWGRREYEAWFKKWFSQFAGPKGPFRVGECVSDTSGLIDIKNLRGEEEVPARCMSCGYEPQELEGLYRGYGCPKCKSPLVVKITEIEE